MKRLVWLFLAVLLFAAPTQADDRPKAVVSIEDALPGTWNYISSSPTKNGDFQPIEPTKISWTLNADGSGIYYRKINEFNAARIHDELRWSVKGSTLIMDGDIHYTILDWDESRMTWQNPSKTTFIRLEKQK